jgi:hypothetical protein
MRFLRLAREKRASTATILAVGGGSRKIAGVVLLDRGRYRGKNGSHSTPGARRGVKSNGTTAILPRPCAKVNRPRKTFRIPGEAALKINDRGAWEALVVAVSDASHYAWLLIRRSAILASVSLGSLALGRQVVAAPTFSARPLQDRHLGNQITSP